MKRLTKQYKKWVIGIIVVAIAVVSLGVYSYHQHVTNSNKPIDPTDFSLATKNVVNTNSAKNRQSVVEGYKNKSISGYTDQQKADYYSQLAAAEVGNNDCKSAVSDYQRALQLNASLPGVYLSIARCDAKLGDKVSAKTNYQKAIDGYQVLVSQDPSIGLVIQQAKNEEIAL